MWYTNNHQQSEGFWFCWIDTRVAVWFSDRIPNVVRHVGLYPVWAVRGPFPSTRKQRRTSLQCTCHFAQMSAGTNNELMLDVHDLSESSTGEKRKREGKFRSKAWDHFTKLIKEDGTYEKCKCNHCHKLFTCSSKSGTTHLLRHITEGICPVFKKEKRDGTPSALAYLRGSSEPRGSVLPWKYDQGSSQQIDGQDPLLPVSIDDDIENQTSEGLGLGEDYGDQATTANLGKLPQLGGLKSQPRGESWLNEFRACVKRLVDLTNEGVPKGSAMKPCSAVAAPDYSIATALRFLNEMDDIPQSSEMYLDAFELLKDAGERECFICLPPEPRRRWLQRMLHRQHPLRYAYSF